MRVCRRALGAAVVVLAALVAPETARAQEVVQAAWSPPAGLAASADAEARFEERVGALVAKLSPAQLRMTWARAIDDALQRLTDLPSAAVAPAPPSSDVLVIPESPVMVEGPDEDLEAGPTLVLGSLRVTFAPVVLPASPVIESERGDQAILPGVVARLPWSIP
ncbi:hypothetical protein WMF18_42565 [Sorangium sp. So ce315]|uniref:hypothetical protein n=1 Tax=Sorangium sp. So ce315 TaxID=3133299 RepID=UPI003F5DA210